MNKKNQDLFLKEHFLNLKSQDHGVVAWLLCAFARAANLEQGHWTVPYYDCHGLVKMWKITYEAPFFGWDSLRNRREFK